MRNWCYTTPVVYPHQWCIICSCLLWVWPYAVRVVNHAICWHVDDSICGRRIVDSTFWISVSIFELFELFLKNIDWLFFLFLKIKVLKDCIYRLFIFMIIKEHRLTDISWDSLRLPPKSIRSKNRMLLLCRHYIIEGNMWCIPGNNIYKINNCNVIKTKKKHHTNNKMET